MSDRFPPCMVLSRQVPHRYRMETIVSLFNRDLSSSHLFHSPKYHQVWHPFKLFSRDTYIAPPSEAAETEIHCLLLMNPIQVNTTQLQDIVLRVICAGAINLSTTSRCMTLRFPLVPCNQCQNGTDRSRGLITHEDSPHR